MSISLVCIVHLEAIDFDHAGALFLSTKRGFRGIIEVENDGDEIVKKTICRKVDTFFEGRGGG
jgi:hypothetical protein